MTEGPVSYTHLDVYKRQIIQGSALKALEDPMGPWGDKIMELMDTVDSYIPDPERCLLYTSPKYWMMSRQWVMDIPQELP